MVTIINSKASASCSSLLLSALFNPLLFVSVAQALMLDRHHSRYYSAGQIGSLPSVNTILTSKVPWLLWCWISMFVASLVQASGMVGGIVGVFVTVGSALSDSILALIITGSCAVLLFVGRYSLIERFSTAMVASFTIFAVLSLYWTEFGITGWQLADGLRFSLPENFIVAFAAFAAFGVIGVGASELIFYPYWCLEKGYAKHIGPSDGSAEWTARAQGRTGISHRSMFEFRSRKMNSHFESTAR